jgi:Stress responsive A/B Barrel Domain
MKTKIFVTLFILTLSTMTGYSQSKAKQVKHVVVFKFKADATTEQVAEVTKAFKALKSSILGIISVENGSNMSTENLNKGFNHVYLLTFENVASRDAYLPHPEHKKFGDLLGKLQVVEDVFVVDFVTE